MSVTISEMSIQEKLDMLELLWDDLCRQEAAVPLPAWQAAILRDRQAAIARGEAEYVDAAESRRTLLSELGCE